MSEEEIIEQAKKLLQPIEFEPHYTAYFVTKDDGDMGGEDYCINCIKDAVRETRKNYKEQRQSILDKFQEIEDTGFYKGKNIKEKYSELEIRQAKRRELKEYPVKVKFGYEGHDPDFGGGKHEPNYCAGCGDYFFTEFEPDMDYAEISLAEFGDGLDIAESLKWKLDMAFYNFQYLDKDVKRILLLIAGKIIANK